MEKEILQKRIEIVRENLQKMAENTDYEVCSVELGDTDRAFIFLMYKKERYYFVETLPLLDPFWNISVIHHADYVGDKSGLVLRTGNIERIFEFIDIGRTTN